jgi:hypothetical protein
MHPHIHHLIAEKRASNLHQEASRQRLIQEARQEPQEPREPREARAPRNPGRLAQLFARITIART